MYAPSRLVPESNLLRSPSLKTHNMASEIALHCSKVREITDDNRADIAGYTSFTLEEHLKRAGAKEAVGEAGFTTLERVWHRPTCEYVGPSPDSQIPSLQHTPPPNSVTVVINL